MFAIDNERGSLHNEVAKKANKEYRKNSKSKGQKGQSYSSGGKIIICVISLVDCAEITLKEFVSFFF